jgi:hypothetical protein
VVLTDSSHNSILKQYQQSISTRILVYMTIVQTVLNSLVYILLKLGEILSEVSILLRVFIPDTNNQI